MSVCFILEFSLPYRKKWLAASAPYCLYDLLEQLLYPPGPDMACVLSWRAEPRVESESFVSILDETLKEECILVI